MIWYDWHAKRRTSMKYNPDVCMKYKINDMINKMWNDMKNDMIMKWKKMLGTHVLLCALGYPYPSHIENPYPSHIEILGYIKNPILFEFDMDKRSSYVILFNSQRWIE